MGTDVSNHNMHKTWCILPLNRFVDICVKYMLLVFLSPISLPFNVPIQLNVLNEPPFLNQYFWAD